MFTLTSPPLLTLAYWPQESFGVRCHDESVKQIILTKFKIVQPEELWSELSLGVPIFREQLFPDSVHKLNINSLTRTIASA